MRELMERALRTSKADYTEIRIEQQEASKVIFRGRDLETADVVIDVGGIVRSLYRDGGWGIATFNSLDDLPARVEQAYRCAKAVHGEPIELAEVSPSQERITVPLVKDFRGISLETKKTLIESYNEILLSYGDAIQDTTARYTDHFSRVFYANSEGTFIEEERPEVSVALSAVARQGDNVQRGFEGLALVQGFEGVEGQEELAHKAARRALDLLRAETVVGGRYPVILDQRLAGVFIHEAFGHLSEADFVYANPQAQEMMVLGRRFGRDILTVVDDGSIPGLRGTHKYDDEGTAMGRTELIRNGILVGRLHSRETAAKMGERPTGNARATGYRYPPIVRMTNTFIEAGQTPFADMLRDIDLGVYACGMFGGQTMLENFSFSSAYAYMIRRGQIAEMVKDVVLSGNLFVTLQNIDAIGDDFQWERLPGGCGKGQGSLPVSTGAPHVRIQDVIIGGR